MNVDLHTGRRVIFPVIRNISEHWQLGTDGNDLENRSQTVSSSAEEDSEVGEDHRAIPVDDFAKSFSINSVGRRVRW